MRTRVQARCGEARRAGGRGSERGRQAWHARPAGQPSGGSPGVLPHLAVHRGKRALEVRVPGNRGSKGSRKGEKAASAQGRCGVPDSAGRENTVGVRDGASGRCKQSRGWHKAQRAAPPHQPWWLRAEPSTRRTSLVSAQTSVFLARNVSDSEVGAARSAPLPPPPPSCPAALPLVSAASCAGLQGIGDRGLGRKQARGEQRGGGALVCGLAALPHLVLHDHGGAVMCDSEECSCSRRRVAGAGLTGPPLAPA